MSRCDYDGIFYRVFCVTLLATAFTFTVILTNVFIDIDGLLSKKAKQNHDTKQSQDFTQNENFIATTNAPYESTAEDIYDKNYIDDQTDTPFRTKRSLDSPNFLSHLRNPKMKKILTARLAKLLEHLDEEEDTMINSNKKEYIDLDNNKNPEELQIRSVDEFTKEYDRGKKDMRNDKDLLHMAMHNILLQGIIGHMDLNDVYKRVNALVKNFSNERYQQVKDSEIPEQIKLDKNTEINLNNLSEEEIKFFEELVNCKKLQEEIKRRTNKNSNSYNKTASKALYSKEPELLFKTTIEIKSLNFNKQEKEKSSYSNSQEKNKGIMKIIFNDKLMNFDDRERPYSNQNTKYEKSYQDVNSRNYPKESFDIGEQLKSNENHKSSNILNDNSKQNNESYYLKKAVEYLKKHVPNNRPFESLADVINKNDTKRLKRQIKIRYEDDNKRPSKIKPIRNGIKKTDDDLYVEIETHFDSKGLRGERKKKLVRSLIDKIQKAIRSDTYSQENNKKKVHRHLQIKKRTQNSLKSRHPTLLNKYVMNMDPVEHRQLNPINKILSTKELSHDQEVQAVGNWKKTQYSKSSLTIPNPENSAETDYTNSEYVNVLNSGVPQRLQLPLNTDVANNVKGQDAFTDTGNVTLFIKDVDGSGFSVGFNQYVDEPPDVESMKIFSGLENLIKTYHENYDQNNNENPYGNEIDDSIERQHELTKRNININRDKHFLFRRSIQELNNEDYHSNAYKIVFDSKLMPFENYHHMLHPKNKESLSSNYEFKSSDYNYNPKNIKIITKDIKIKEVPLVLEENIFENKLKPSDLFNLASLFKRKKRSLNVQKITNLKSRIKLNRYLNTKSMQSKKIFLKNKRNKREIDKIRIIASDHMHHVPKNSDENFFVVSGENLFTNRAVLREIELPESDIGDEAGEEQNDETIPYTYEETYPETSYMTNVFGAKSRHNSLMSKYPHIFTDDTTGSKELHYGHEYVLRERNKPQFKLENLLGMTVTTENSISSETDVPIPEIVDAIMPPPSKSNYKVTVKILPKNLTNAPSGFKEMHTVINKTYNNNGVQYYSLVNVSEISKIENINKTKENLLQQPQKAETSNQFQEQENKMKLLLALQKEKIEQQLANLNKEKAGLETILRLRDGTKERNMNDLLREFLHLETQKKNEELQFFNDPYIYRSQMKSLAGIESTTMSTSTVTTKATTIPTPVTTPTNQKLNQPRRADTEKIKVTASIKENENLTNEILSKINKNTDMLQCFLKKLTEKLNPPSPVESTHNTPAIIEKATEESKYHRPHDVAKDWSLNLHHMHDTVFGDHIPTKNDSHYAIPFVYAYQHPYLPPNKPPLPMAKVVYHGHIHTNAIHKHPNEIRKYNANNSKPNHISSNGVNHENGTRFFIDALANDFDVLPSKHVQKLEIHVNGINATSVH